MTEESQELKNPQLHDQLMAALADQMKGAEESQETEVVEPEPEAPATEVVAESEVTEEVTTEEEVTEESPEEPTWLPKEQRELYMQASPEQQAAWASSYKALQGNYTRATQQLKEKTEQLSRFDQALSPYRPLLAQAGATPEQAIPYLFNWYQQLVADPRGTIARIAQSVGLSADTVNPLNSGLDADPQITALRNELNQVRQTLAAGQRRQVMTEEQRVQGEIAQFRDQADKDGALLHPHFDRVQSAMVPFVQSGLTLAQAYEKAIWTDDELREQLVADRAKAALKRTAVKKIATKPKASGSGASPVKDVSKMSLAEQLKHNWDSQIKAGSSS